MTPEHVKKLAMRNMDPWDGLKIAVDEHPDGVFQIRIWRTFASAIVLEERATYDHAQGRHVSEKWQSYIIQCLVQYAIDEMKARVRIMYETDKKVWCGLVERET